jgi:hypothetical protein
MAPMDALICALSLSPSRPATRPVRIASHFAAEGLVFKDPILRRFTGASA